MNEKEAHQFSSLKKEVAAKMSRDFSMSSADISEWKGEDIVIFQEALLHQVKGQISTKWFYTHMKSSSKSLPRIDVLNMLSQFVEYDNWADFLHRNSNKKKSKRNKITSLFIFLLVPVLIWSIPNFISSKDTFYTISIIDFDTNEPPENPIEFELLKPDESSQKITTDSLGQLVLPVNEALNTLVIKSPYYKEDTLQRKIIEEGGEIFKVKTDDYALMVHYFSKSKVKDWKRRRRMLAKIFHNEAEIIEVYKGTYGIEKYTKQEFINKITMPLTSLKTLEVIDTQRQGGKIIKMRVAQQ